MSLRFRSERELRMSLGEPSAVESKSHATRAKYRNSAVDADGETFDSTWEFQRYQQLQEQQHLGLISELRHKVEYPLHVVNPRGDRILVASYEVDIEYRHPALSGERVYEDTKSAATRKAQAFRLKAKMFEAEYGVRLLEVTRVPRNRKNREIVLR